MSLSELAGLEAREEVSLVEACGRRGWLFDRVERKRKGCAGGGSRRCGLWLLASADLTCFGASGGDVTEVRGIRILQLMTRGRVRLGRIRLKPGLFAGDEHESLILAQNERWRHA